ncbi:hypothetical protein [Klebsiella quasipneumoniae]|uniref:hypothetical protein n=1 Tax=Klebsiella quasipneumoniae TaxID=1463165 RepID=UPI003F6DF911
MLLELLDSRFKVNPWHGKSVFGPRRELANCADVCPFLPKILFGPAGAHWDMFHLTMYFALKASLTMRRERGGKKSLSK